MTPLLHHTHNCVSFRLLDVNTILLHTPTFHWPYVIRPDTLAEMCSQIREMDVLHLVHARARIYEYYYKADYHQRNTKLRSRALVFV